MGLFNRGKSTKTVHKSVRLTRDGSGSSATSLQKIEQASSTLVKSAEAASNSLSKHGLLGIRGKSVLVLDYSGSMDRDYRSGAVQALTERALAFGLQFASDERVTIIPFATNVMQSSEVGLTNFQGVIDREVRGHSMGSTNLTAALKVVRDLSDKSDELIFCTVVTDGNPDNKTTASEIVCELAGYPVFIKFVALGSVPYLQTLDDLGPDKRLLDNVDAKFFPNLDSITDQEFAEAMAEEWSEWLKAAQDAGVLTN